MGCTTCVNVCPSGALSFEDTIENDKAKRILTHRVDLCIFCGQCQANCPTGGGIKLTREFDLATLGRREDLKDVIEKELFLCDGCKEIVAPVEQILWVGKKLGPLIFSNASLMLFYLRNLNLAKREEILRPPEEEFLRPDRIKILCPRCRRQTSFKS